MKKLNIVGVDNDFGVGNELDRPGEMSHQNVSKLYDILNEMVTEPDYVEDGAVRVVEKVMQMPIKKAISIWKDNEKKWGRYNYTIFLGKFVATLREAGVILDKKYENLIDKIYYG